MLLWHLTMKMVAAAVIITQEPTNWNRPVQFLKEVKMFLCKVFTEISLSFTFPYLTSASVNVILYILMYVLVLRILVTSIVANPQTVPENCTELCTSYV